MGNVVNGMSQMVHLSNNKLSSRCEIMTDSNDGILDGILEKKGYNNLEYISQWGKSKC